MCKVVIKYLTALIIYKKPSRSAFKPEIGHSCHQEGDKKEDIPTFEMPSALPTNNAER
jgi:hypothetical protein